MRGARCAPCDFSTLISMHQPCPFCLFIFLFSAQLQLQSPSFEKQGKGDGDGQSTLYVATGVTLRHLQGVTRAGQHGSGCTPPPPVPKNHLAQEPTPGSAVKFSHHFFYQGSGFFMFLVDVGQLFRCAGHHFMCVTLGPPIRGDPISHSQAHVCFCTTSSIPCSVP